ncbi:hypothetical protein [Aeromicrobium sp. Sec7.5]|uniref:hypothetical protein n=1 Tax=Aeromicrobium sp. Sec7.5 TaxID=3121276 RepID=UPI002FE4B5EC
MERWSGDDVKMASGLFVRNTFYRAEQVVQMPEGRPDREAEIMRKAEREMRLMVLGSEAWES